MGLEIERKFLVRGEAWKPLASPTLMRQAYLSAHPERVVRVRVEGEQAYLTIKSKAQGIARSEWEYPIPLADAQALLDQVCEHPLIEKYRYRIPIGKHVWEVDEFLGQNSGLVVAEIELASETETFLKPDWLGEEVSHDHRYANSQLIRRPYSSW